ncbi:MAG: hypothetical protein ACRC4L_01135 [Mycoplasma sp.]
MSIKLIYGNNGAGKTKYAQKMKGDSSKYFAIDSDLKGWYDDVQKKFSHANFFKNKKNDEIEVKVKKIKSVKSRIITDFNFEKDTWKLVFKEDFKTALQWYDFKKNIEKEEVNIESEYKFNNIEYIEYFAKVRKWLSGLSNEKVELLFIFLSLKYEQTHDYKEFASKEINQQILNIKETLLLELNEINHVDLSEIAKLNIEPKIIWKMLNMNDGDVSEFLERKFRIAFVNHRDVIEIFEIFEEIDNLSKNKNFLTFESLINDKEFKVVDNGLSISIDLSEENYSQGQRNIKMFEIILRCFKNYEKTLILDDFLEKLDTNNLREAAQLVCDNADSDIEILTHELIVVDILEEEFKNNDLNLNTYIIGDNDELMQHDLFLTFQSLNLKLISGSQSDCSRLLENPYFIFSKIMARYIAYPAAVTEIDFDKKDFNDNLMLNTFSFISENVYHYSEFNLDGNNQLKKIMPVGLLNCNNSIDVIDYLLSLFGISVKDSYGLSKQKIISFLNEIKKYLTLEKDYYDDNWDSNNIIKKSIFYNNFYSGSSIDKKKRNLFIHSLDRSLISILK